MARARLVVSALTALTLLLASGLVPLRSYGPAQAAAHGIDCTAAGWRSTPTVLSCQDL
jgi:hypothetical protein